MFQNRTLHTFAVLIVAMLALEACGGGGGKGNSSASPGSLGMNPGEFASYASSKNKGNMMNRFGGGALPARVDLREKGWVPTSTNQGRIGSCVGFATAYGMKSIQESAEESWKPDHPSRLFSPAFVYNQILRSDNCQAGSLPKDAVELLVKKGCATLATMAYTDKDCLTQPTSAALEEAKKYRARRSIQLQLNAASIKASLAAGNPVVMGIFVYEPFQRQIATRTR